MGRMEFAVIGSLEISRKNACPRLLLSNQTKAYLKLLSWGVMSKGESARRRQ